MSAEQSGEVGDRDQRAVCERSLRVDRLVRRRTSVRTEAMTAYVRSLDRPTRIAIAFASAMLFVSTWMFAMSSIGMRWNRPLLVAPLALLGFFLQPRSELTKDRRGRLSSTGILLICA